MLSGELIKRNPNIKGLSQINIRYAERFYTLYKKIFPQVAEQLLLIPWGHHRIIIDKCKTLEKCIFYIKQTVENNLSRYDLENRILAETYERSQNTIDNFDKLLINVETGISNQIMNDPYEFDFLTIREQYDEKDLTDGSWSEFIEAEEIKKDDT